MKILVIALVVMAATCSTPQADVTTATKDFIGPAPYTCPAPFAEPCIVPSHCVAKYGPAKECHTWACGELHYEQGDLCCMQLAMTSVPCLDGTCIDGVCAKSN
jgi:hypothetical protein